MVIDVLKYMTNMSNRKKGMRKEKNLRQKSSKKRMGNASMIPRPPQLNGYEVKHNKVLRFVVSTAFAAAITFQNLLDTILFTGDAGTTAYDLFYMVRVARIKAWALPVVGGAESITIIFDGQTAGSQGDRTVHTDTSMGIEPAYFSAAPRVDTLASKFQISSGQTAFFLDVPAGAVVDVSLEFHSDCLKQSVAAAVAPVGAAVGCIAFRGLDGQALSATKFIVPVGLNQV
jgi:hypothetical protein